jgi:hypothetical protein
VANFSGGIGNSGTIAANFAGISVQNVLAFSGGISNGGSISLTTGAGIAIASV